MRRIFLFLALAAGAAAQSNVVPICDQQAISHCWYVTGGATLTADQTLQLTDAGLFVPAGSSMYNATGAVTLDTTGIKLIPTSGHLVSIGSANVEVDIAGNVTMAGAATALQVTGASAGIDVTTATAFNAIQAPAGGVLGEMLTANGGYIGPTGSTGGYLDIALLPGASCTDIWGNQVSFPTHTPQQSSGFGSNDGVWWNGPSPLYGGSPSNCAPSPFVGQQTTNGINVNEYIGSLGGLASFSSAYNSIQSLTGGIFAGTTLISGQPWFTQAYPSSASLLTPSAGFGYSLTSATYVSGGTVTGAAGTYCAVGPFNGGTFQTGAQGLVTLTGTNSIAGATISFINPTSGALQGGYYYATAPTQGQLNNGRNVVWPGHTPATCSGAITITSTIAPVLWGGIGYKGGSVYWYWNDSTSAWAQADFSALTTPLWTLTGTNLYPSNTTYKVEVGESSNTTGAALEVSGAIATTGLAGVISSNVSGTSTGNPYGLTFQGNGGTFQVDYLGDVSMGGTLHITPALDTTDMGFNISQTTTGSTATPVAAGVQGLNQIVVTDGANNGSGTQTGQALRIYSTYGGSSMTGIRNALESDIVMSSAPSASDTNPGYVAILGTVQVFGNMGGTALAPRGAYWGGSDDVVLAGSATYINAVVGREIDWGGLTGSSVAINTGLSLVSGGPVHGSLVDAALNFGSAAPGFATNYLMYIGDFHSGAAVGTNTTILGTDGNAHEALSGIDFGAYGFSSYVLHSNYFYVDGAGNVTQSVPTTGDPVRTEYFGVNTEMFVGTESVTGSSYLPSGTPYAGFIYQTQNVPIQMGTNGHINLTLTTSGDVSSPGLANFVGGYEVNSVASINTSNQFVGSAVNVSGAVQCGVTGAAICFQGNGGTFQVSGAGAVSAAGPFNSTNGYEVGGTTLINSSGVFVGSTITPASGGLTISPYVAVTSTTANSALFVVNTCTSCNSGTGGLGIYDFSPAGSDFQKLVIVNGLTFGSGATITAPDGSTAYSGTAACTTGAHFDQLIVSGGLLVGWHCS